MGQLFFRSVIVLAILLGMLFAIGAGVLYYFGCPLWCPFVFAISIVLLQYLLTPTIIDWFYKINWTDPKDISPEFSIFLTDLCKKRRIPVPRFGIIEDGNPNAFTYGHAPSDARLVVTRGIHQILTEDEFNAVVAHEVGHIWHRDFIVMTFASLIPLLLYILYSWSGGYDQRSRRMMFPSEGRQNGTMAAIVAVGAWICYYLSQYLVLFLSRIREYYADEHAAYSVKSPNSIATALIKIAYGLARISQDDLDANAKRRKSQLLRASSLMGPLGICGIGSASPLALYSTNNTGHFAIDKMVKAMQWDLWNPWARIFELQSTHPLVAKRVQAVAKIAKIQGAPRLFEYSKPPKNSYWTEFITDAIFAALPYLGTAVFAISSEILGNRLLNNLQSADFSHVIINHVLVITIIIGGSVIITHVGWMFRLAYSYGSPFKKAKIEDLVGEVAVSHVRCIPVEIRGRIIGRGVPGLLWSKDFVVQDDTGFITLIYRQPLWILELLFGIFGVPMMQDREGVFRGWYRRGPTPYLELSEARFDDGTRLNCAYQKFLWAFAIFGVIVGIVVCCLEPYLERLIVR